MTSKFFSPVSLSRLSGENSVQYCRLSFFKAVILARWSKPSSLIPLQSKECPKSSSLRCFSLTRCRRPGPLIRLIADKSRCSRCSSRAKPSSPSSVNPFELPVRFRDVRALSFDRVPMDSLPRPQNCRDSFVRSFNPVRCSSDDFGKLHDHRLRFSRAGIHFTRQRKSSSVRVRSSRCNWVSLANCFAFILENCLGSKVRSRLRNAPCVRCSPRLRRSSSLPWAVALGSANGSSGASTFSLGSANGSSLGLEMRSVSDAKGSSHIFFG